MRHSCHHDCWFACCAQSLPREYRPTCQCLHVLTLRSCSSYRKGGPDTKSLCANKLQVGGHEALPEVDSELSSLATPPVDLCGFRAATRSSMLDARLRLLGWAARAKGPAMRPSVTGLAATCKPVGLVSRLLAAASARSLRDRAQTHFQQSAKSMGMHQAPLWYCEPGKHGMRTHCGCLPIV